MSGLMKVPARIRKFVPHRDGLKSDEKHAEAGRALPVLKPEGFDRLAHDARNVLSALQLYCELLAEPGVLSTPHTHYAQELQAISDTTVRLVEGMSISRRSPRRTESRKAAADSFAQHVPLGAAYPSKTGIAESREGIDDLGQELQRMRPLLTAIAGTRIELEVESQPCAGRIQLSNENLTRVLLNLVRNASEAMPGGGKLRITAQYSDGFSFLDPSRLTGAPKNVVIAVQDNGPGIPEHMREQIFNVGFTTRKTTQAWPAVQHRGLGLSTVRALVEASGGSVRLSSSAGRGARFELELPVTYGTYQIADSKRLVADSEAKGCIECQ
jgi:signal transduction histidine kinase